MAKKDKKTGKRMTAAEEAASAPKEAEEVQGEVSGNARKFVRQPGDGKIVKVIFQQSHGSYNGGELAGFGTAKANELVKAGVARLAGDEKYERPPTTKQIQAKDLADKRKAAAASKAAAKEAKVEAKETSTGE